MYGGWRDSAVRVGDVAGVSVWTVAGDIAALDVDVVVNAANDRGWMGSGVAGAIKRGGGAVVEDEAMATAPRRPGTAWTTSAGTLAAGHVVHAAAMGQDARTDSGLIEAATRAAVACVRELGAETVAFPALGTGVGGFPLVEAAEVMARAVSGELSEAAASITDIVFAICDPAAARSFGSVVRVALSPARAN